MTNTHTSRNRLISPNMSSFSTKTTIYLLNLLLIIILLKKINITPCRHQYLSFRVTYDTKEAFSVRCYHQGDLYTLIYLFLGRTHTCSTTKLLEKRIYVHHYWKLIKARLFHSTYFCLCVKLFRYKGKNFLFKEIPVFVCANLLPTICVSIEPRNICLFF